MLRGRDREREREIPFTRANIEERILGKVMQSEVKQDGVVEVNLNLKKKKYQSKKKLLNQEVNSQSDFKQSAIVDLQAAENKYNQGFT